MSSSLVMPLCPGAAAAQGLMSPGEAQQQHRASGARESGLSFLGHHEAIQAAAERKHQAGEREPDNSILIDSDDL